VIRAGIVGVALIFAVGLWLLAAPFALRYQPEWTGATRDDMITGGSLAIAGFAGIFGVIVGQVREMYADARSAASAAAAADKGKSAP
jgi:drug/metabolite transporter (DMT)-like permease